ncbi:MAG: ABC transporter ATP-binding protein [Thermoanaerobaculales bacterium]
MRSVLRLLALARVHWRVYAVAVLAIAIGTGCFLLVPRKMGEFVEALSHLTDARLDVALFRPAIDIAGLLILQALFTAVYSYLVAIASERIVNDLRGAFFSNLVSRPLDEASPKQLGAIASEFASDLAVIQAGLSDTLTGFLRHAIFTIGAVTALFFVDFWMTAISLAGVGIISLVILAFVKLATKAVVSVQRYRARTVSLLIEAATNAYVIQAYDRIDYMDARFVERLEETFARVKRHLRLMAFMNPVTLVVFAVIISGTLALGILAVREGRLSVADLVSYFTYAVVLVASVSQIGQLAGRLYQSGVLFEKHGELLSPIAADPAARPGQFILPGDSALPAPRESTFGYVLENVAFSYPGTEHLALSDVSFAVPAGLVTAIIGESGAGKSTVAGLFCGVFRPTSGTIRFIDRDGNAIEPPSRGRIAVVPQEPSLFAGTVSENISFGRPGLGTADIERAAREAQIHDHIRGLPGGYEAGVEEGGRNFSRGQQQRLALARALVGRPRLLILDEATASVDVVTEDAIKTAIQALRGEATIVVIAHQGKLLTEVDHLIVLDRGRLATSGPPGRPDVANEVVVHLSQLRCPRASESVGDGK